MFTPIPPTGAEFEPAPPTPAALPPPLVWWCAVCKLVAPAGAGWVLAARGDAPACCGERMCCYALAALEGPPETASAL